MRLLHQVHIAVLVVFFVVALYHLDLVEMLNLDWRQTSVPSGRMSTWGTAVDHARRAALFAGLACLVTFLVGYWTRLAAPKLGGALMLTGVLGMSWKAVMYASPEHLALSEVFPAWVLYVVLGILTSAYLVHTDPAVQPTPSLGAEDVLDDQWEEF